MKTFLFNFDYFISDEGDATSGIEAVDAGSLREAIEIFEAKWGANRCADYTVACNGGRAHKIND